jgi:hypothetical protein
MLSGNSRVDTACVGGWMAFHVPSGLTARKAGDGLSVLASQEASPVYLNPSAALIWRMACEGMSVLEIEAAIGDRFGSSDAVLQDVDDALCRLVADGCLVPVWGPGEVVTLGHALEPDQEDARPRRSGRAERLVDYCLGDYRDQPPPPCSLDPDYVHAPPRPPVVFACEARRSRLVLACRRSSAMQSVNALDQKRIGRAWVDQRTRFPRGFRAWLIQGDDAGEWTDPSQGLHMGMVRQSRYRHVVLAPSAGRGRYLGPRLGAQMQDLREQWTPWAAKRDAAWWGGAATGPGMRGQGQLTRFAFIEHFHRHPDDRVRCHVAEYPQWQPDPGSMPEPAGRFDPRDAYAYKCLVLMMGNDIPSGMSWFFCGNSVVLMQPPEFEAIHLFELQPWVHFVPLEPDPADVLVKLDWVLQHQDEAQRIVKRAHERLAWLAGPEYLWACNEVLRRVGPREVATG